MLTFDYEKALVKDITSNIFINENSYFHVPIMGIDEVGRGCIAGPVVAAAVVLKKTISADILSQIKDSKKISKKKREFLYKVILKNSLYSISVSTVEIIEKINILNAALLAMQNASLNILKQNKSICGILVDGIHKFPSDIQIQTLVNGDNKSLNIAAASILSKVYRDNLMLNLASYYPNYGWEKNVGYGTKLHLESLKMFQITPHHRKTFAPIKNMFLNNQNEKIS